MEPLKGLLIAICLLCIVACVALAVCFAYFAAHTNLLWAIPAALVAAVTFYPTVLLISILKD